MNSHAHVNKTLEIRFQLYAHESETLHVVEGMSICCERGLIGVTRTTDSRHHVLPRGLCFVASHDCRVTVNGLAEDSLVDVGPSRAPSTVTLEQQPLRIDWNRVAQINRPGNCARAEHLASAFHAAGQAVRRWYLWLKDVTSAATIHKSGDKS